MSFILVSVVHTPPWLCPADDRWMKTVCVSVRKLPVPDGALPLNLCVCMCIHGSPLSLHARLLWWGVPLHPARPVCLSQAPWFTHTSCQHTHTHTKPDGHNAAKLYPMPCQNQYPISLSHTHTHIYKARTLVWPQFQQLSVNVWNRLLKSSPQLIMALYFTLENQSIFIIYLRLHLLNVIIFKIT